MKIYDELPQHLEDGTPNEDWLKIRANKFTASDFYLFMSLLDKDKLTDTAESRLYEKVLANFGEISHSVTTTAMERGTELEPEARELYRQETFEDVREVGFVDWEKLRAGVSPDGVIYGADGNIERIVEHKCPGIKNYLKMAKGKIPTQYIIQVQMQLLVTGAKSCDFVIYHPDMRLVIKKFTPDEQTQKDIITVLEKLNARYDAILEEIQEFRK